MRLVLRGNHAVAYAAKLSRVEVVAAYPITPQTEIVELLSNMVASGELNAKFINIESEHSAMAVCIGASATGARAFTATSSQGLALMHELLHWAANARLPVVMANVNRAMAPPWSIWTEQTDSLAQRDTGWLQVYCSNNQEVFDTIIQLFKVCERVSLPGMAILDAFLLSHTNECVEIPEQETVDKFLPPYNPKIKIDVDEPHAFGGVTNPDYYYEFRYKIQCAMEQAKKEIVEIGKEYGELFGRSYGLLEEFFTDDSEIILITAGSLASTAKQAVYQMRKDGKKVGLVRLRFFRPFPSEELRRILVNAKYAGVIDRNISFGNQGIIFTEVKSALFNICRGKDYPKLYGFIAGLGGRDVRIKDINWIVDYMLNNEPEEIIWVGLKR